jgi:hypothetical protein
MQIGTRTNEVTELIINDNCEFDDFYSFAGQLKNKLKIRYYNKLDDYDSLWYDFDFEGRKLTLHYNIYFGISIYPQKGNKASTEEIHVLYSIKSTLES